MESQDGRNSSLLGLPTSVPIVRLPMNCSDTCLRDTHSQWFPKQAILNHYIGSHLINASLSGLICTMEPGEAYREGY